MNDHLPPPGWYKNNVGQEQWWDGHSWGTLASELQQPQNEAPSVTAVGGKKKKGIALSALLVGIVAFLLGWTPLIGLLIALVAIVLSIVGLAKQQSKGLALTGLILAILAAVTSLLMFVANFSSFVDGFEEGVATSSNTEEEKNKPLPSEQCLSATAKASKHQEELYDTHEFYSDEYFEKSEEEQELIMADENRQWDEIMSPLYSECSSPADLYAAFKEYPDVAGYTRDDAFDEDVIEIWCAIDAPVDAKACVDWENWVKN